MANEYFKRSLIYAAVATLGVAVVKHPGGEATVRYFPDGHVEIVPYFDIDLSQIDPKERLSRRFKLDNVTVASTAIDITDGIKAI